MTISMPVVIGLLIAASLLLFLTYRAATSPVERETGTRRI